VIHVIKGFVVPSLISRLIVNEKRPKTQFILFYLASLNMKFMRSFQIEKSNEHVRSYDDDAYSTMMHACLSPTPVSIVQSLLSIVH
jgi:hypothetical protein